MRIIVKVRRDKKMVFSTLTSRVMSTILSRTSRDQAAQVLPLIKMIRGVRVSLGAPPVTSTMALKR